MGRNYLFVILGLFLLSGISAGDDDGEEAATEDDEQVPTPPKCDNCTKVRFVLSARELPSVKNFLGAKTMPVPYVKVEYFPFAKASKPKKFTMSTLDPSHNPDWPDIFTVLYREGKGQRFKFTIKSKETAGKDKEISHVVVSLKDIAKAPNSQLQKDLIGPISKDGTLWIYTEIDLTPDDGTDPRLSGVMAKRTKVFKIDKF